MHVQESRATALEQLQQALGQRYRLFELADERFDQTHEHFERSSDQQRRILEWLENLVRAHYLGMDPLRILSVGCGSGILDNSLLEALAFRSKQIVYTGVDPNGVACRRFVNDFERLGMRNVRLEVREQNIETACCADRFDLVHAVHSLYYFSDPAATLDFLLRLLDPGGKLVIIQAPKAELNQLANSFWCHHADGVIWFSDRLAQHLSHRGLHFSRQRIHAWVNVARCFESGCPRGEMMLDFITQTDCRHLDDNILQLCLSYLRAISHQEKDRLLAPHPVDVFLIDAPTNSAPTAH